MNLFNQPSLTTRFLIAPVIALVLILILYFSSNALIQKYQDLFHDLSNSNLPQYSQLNLSAIKVVDNHIDTAALLVSVAEGVDEKNISAQRDVLLKELHTLTGLFDEILFDRRTGRDAEKIFFIGQRNLAEEISLSLQQYKDASARAIELATDNLDQALKSLGQASKALKDLNSLLLKLAEKPDASLAAVSVSLEQTAEDDTGLIILTVILVYIMLYVAFYFSVRLSLDLELINNALTALSKGETDIELPEKADSYLKQLTTVVEKFKYTLQQNKLQQESLKRSIEELNESQSRYQQIFETNQAVKLIIDLQSGKIVEANEAAIKFYGYDENTLLGMHIGEINTLSDEEINAKMISANAKETSLFNFRHKLASGEIRDVEVYSGPIHSNGRNLLYSIVHDVTERKRAERALIDSEVKYRSIIQSTVVAVIVSDSKGHILEWNTGAEQIFGYTVEEILGKPLNLLIPERFLSLHKKRFIQAVESRSLIKKEQMLEVSGLRKNGQEFPVELTIGSWSSGDELYFSAIILDVTERKHAELGLRRSQKMDAIGQLTGGIAHDFNNILGIILGNVDLLERKLDADRDIQKRIDGIKRSAQRAADLTRQLLGFSRREASTTATTDINILIQNMQSLISRSLTPQVDVNYQFSENLWLTTIDPGDFEDALLNLTINARDAMSGRGCLVIETSNRELDEEFCRQNSGAKPGAYVELAITDNGEGIPFDLQERIFEPFFTTKEQGKGTGLGLAMVFGFVQRSGGSIKIYSEKGIGTTFRIYLPRAETQDGDDYHSDYDTPVENLPHGKERILIVDDEEDLLDIASNTLRTLGYTVEVAKDGGQALEKLEQERFDLLFTDVVMPEMNGYELAELAVKKSRETRILLTSGYTDKAIVSNEQTQLNVALLSKPYTLAALARRVREVLDSD